MPEYTYKHPKKDIYIDVVQGINEKHVFFKNGVEWQRVFSAPQIGIQTKIDPFSKRQFVEKTGQSRGSVGDVLDRSAELSQKRKDQTGGIDPLQEKHFSDYARIRHGKRHPSDPKRYAKLNKLGGSFF